MTEYKYCDKISGRAFWVAMPACDNRIEKGRCRRVTRVINHHRVETCEPIQRRKAALEEEDGEID